jgi:diacylglycerol kinase family enzyme
LDAGLAGNRIFLLMAGCGFDADVVRRMHHGRSGNITHFDYAKPLLASLRHYPFSNLRIDYETGNHSGAHEQKTIQARWAFIVNLPRYAGGLKFAPQAVGTDGLLDVCTFQKGNWWHALRYLSGVLTGRHVNWLDCQIVRTRRLQVVADQQSSDEIPFQLDGDPGGVLPVDIRVLPGRLRLLVSERWAEGHGFPVNQESSTLSEQSETRT